MKKDDRLSTKQYVMASELIVTLGKTGSVLVVASTRAQAKQLAQGIADKLPVSPTTSALVAIVQDQLGAAHPLVTMLRRGVGYHHAGLPIEILEALEDAVRSGVLAFLTCTSTLTEGVNLPVRTVVIYDPPQTDAFEDIRLQSARLVNAIGRAGRAGKETEGWIILVRSAKPSDQDFEELTPDANALAISSSLLTHNALTAIAELESTQRANEDAIFQEENSAAADFVSFVWSFLAIAEINGIDPTAFEVDQVVSATLAHYQADRKTQDLLRSLAHSTQKRYSVVDPSDRQRWSRTGTSISSAQIIDRLAREVAEVVTHFDGDTRKLHDPYIALLLLTEAIPQLLNLSEAPPWRFRQTPRGSDIYISPLDFAERWISGEPLPRIAEEILQEVSDPGFRIEQIVDAVSLHFEHYLAWTVGALTELTNLHLEQFGLDDRICPELGAYLRYGVDAPLALFIMQSGVKSRRLATAISAFIDPDTEPTLETARQLLRSMKISDWSTILGATSSEIFDILELVRTPQRSLLREILDSGTASVSLATEIAITSQPLETVTLRSTSSKSAPGPLRVFSGELLCGTIQPVDHLDVQEILAAGIPLGLDLSQRGESVTLHMRIASDES